MERANRWYYDLHELLHAKTVFATGGLNITPEQVEKKVIDLIHRQPFIPFVVEMNDGTSLEIPHGRLAINGGGAVFFGPEGGLVDFEFDTVRSIRFIRIEAEA